MNEKDIPFLKNPLTTEDGFLNEACINELNSLIKNMPETYERLKDDPEWNKKQWIFLRDIVGAFACAMIRIQGYPTLEEKIMPPCFEDLINTLYFELKPSFDKNEMAELSLCDINKMCWVNLGSKQIFQNLNSKKFMGKNWIDISALLHYVCLIIRSDWRSAHIGVE